jgi:hypothetical protein
MGTSAAAAAAAAAVAAAKSAATAKYKSSAAAEPSSSSIAKPGKSQQAAGLSAAAAVLEGLLADAWADGEVAAAFEHLEPAPVPVFAELKQQQAQGATLQQQDVAVMANPGQLAAGDEHDLGSASGADAGHSEDAAAEVLQQPEFQAFADFVLESAVVGILQESVLQEELHAA